MGSDQERHQPSTSVRLAVVRCVVDGDDFKLLGCRRRGVESCGKLRGTQEWYELKVEGLSGGAPGEGEEVTI